jgi:1-phosphofructokinase
VITTLTVNPSIDRTISVDRLRIGSSVLATATTVEPAGKGVNVSRALALNGLHTTAIFPLGDVDRGGFGSLAEIMNVRPVRVAGELRTNVTIVEEDGCITRVKEVGPQISSEDVECLLATTVDAALSSNWVVASGSLPPGTSLSIYRDLATRLEGTGARLAVDTSGDALEATVGSPVALLKPNRNELAELVGSPIETLGDVVDAATALQLRAAEVVIVSLGSDGAVLVDKDGVRFGSTAVEAVGNTVGSGDAMLAGFIAGKSLNEDPFVCSLAWASAAVRSLRTAMPPLRSSDWQAVSVDLEIDRTRRLDLGQ